MRLHSVVVMVTVVVFLVLGRFLHDGRLDGVLLVWRWC
jgi:hypothetical protein